MATGATVITFSGPSGDSLPGDVSSDQRWLVSSKIFSNAITLWDIPKAKEVRSYPVMQGKAIEIRFSADHTRIAARDSTGVVTIWDRESGRELRKVADDESSLEDLLGQ